MLQHLTVPTILSSASPGHISMGVILYHHNLVAPRHDLAHAIVVQNVKPLNSCLPAFNTSRLSLKLPLTPEVIYPRLHN